jgi:hypothetical protein
MKISKVTWLCIFIAAMMVFLGFAIPVHAAVTVFGGVDHSQDQGPGTWWQPDSPHTEKLNSFVAGIRYDECKDSWCIGGGLVDLGRFSVSSIDDPSDADYSAHPLGGRLYPLSHFNGSGGTWGVFSAVGRTFGPVKLEIGLSALKPSWTVNVPDWYGCPSCAPQSITVSHASHFQPGLMAGVQYRLTDRLSVEASAWNTASHGDQWVSLFKRTYALTLGYSWK